MDVFGGVGSSGGDRKNREPNLGVIGASFAMLVGNSCLLELCETGGR